MLDEQSHWRFIRKATFMLIEPEVRVMEMHNEGRRVASIFLEDILVRHNW